MPTVGIPQHRRRRDHHGRVAAAELEAREQDVDVVDARVVEIDERVGETATPGERAQRQRGGRVTRADDADRRVVGTATEHLAPRHERREQDVGQVGLGGHEAAQGRRVDADHDGVALGTRGERRPFAGEDAQFTEEPSRAVRGDDPFGAVRRSVVGEDREAAVDDHHEVVRQLALDEGELPGRDRRLAPVAPGDVDHLVGQRREGLVVAHWCSVGGSAVGGAGHVGVELEGDLVDVTPEPLLAGLEALDDRVRGRSEMGRGVAVR